MIRKVVLCLLGAVLLGLLLASVKAGSSVLNEASPRVELEWQVLGDPTTTDPSEVDIEFTITTDTTGWVGLGFALSPAMFPSDNIVMWVDDDTEEAHAEDRFATDHVTPTLDTASGGTDDVELISGEQTETGQTFVVRRKLETDDTMHDHVIGTDPLYVIWAIGDSDTFEEHAAEGFKQLILVGDEEGSVVGSAASDETSASDDDEDSSGNSASHNEGQVTGSGSASERDQSGSQLSSSIEEQDTTGESTTTRAATGLTTVLVALSSILVAAL